MDREQAPVILSPDGEVPAGARVTGFQAILPVSDNGCRAQIAATLARGLPEALSRRRLVVIANGPSALEADLSSLGDTLALNGAIRLFTDKGLSPTYWACCDPQAVVADLLPDDPPKDTIYFVASKCHASVFEKLKDRKVFVWHLLDYPLPERACVALTSSITGSASWMMHRRYAYTDFEYYGWDGCFLGDRHHASDDSPYAGDTLEVVYGGTIVGDTIVGGEKFHTTKSWMAETHDALQFFQLVRYFGIEVTIHGRGMLRCAQKHILSP